MTRGWAWILLVLALVGCSSGFTPTRDYGYGSESPTLSAPATPTASVSGVVERPILAYTPGRTVTDDQAALCSGPEGNPRGYLSAGEKRTALAEYGYPPGTKVAEWDHYIARWAGGASDPTNIWPQVDPVAQARKDALELSLYDATCRDGSMTLAQARAEMLTFWRYW